MNDFFLGVIEGFYGRQWSWAERCDYAAFLAALGYQCYIYAPKGDRRLRSQWRQPLTAETLAGLRQLAARYRQQGLQWGLGLSPLGLSEQFGAADAAALAGKVQALNVLEPDILCILFDDTRGDVAGLAQRQVAVVECVLQHSRATRHMVCPTYYSLDPVLEQVFGPMPENYLRDLGRGLPPSVDIFWTGERVIAPAIVPSDIAPVSEWLERRPVLWDNYPVNDGRYTCKHLHLRPYRDRPATLSQAVAGHVVNPMNQAALSQLVLQSLPTLYADGGAYSPEAAWEQGLAMLEDVAFARQLARDAGRFQDAGLDQLSAAERDRLAACYAAFDHPAAREVVQWLEGQYQFDPDCLTE